MLTNNVEKPKNRGVLRSYLGKEYYIFRRKLKWLIAHSKFATNKEINTCGKYSIIKHKSFLLRPLKNVDMALQYNKITNLKLTISKIDGIIIKPGQVFSIWRLVGRPKKSKGYLDGLVLYNGQISKGVGGGLCQLGNLLYWMVLHSDLDVTERWRHGFDVFPDINRKIPFACGATLSYNYVDLQLTNNTLNTYQIKLWLDKEYLNGELLCDNEMLYAYNIVEKNHFIKQQWWGGYTRHNQIWKQRMNAEGDIDDEQLIVENHAIMMYNPLLES